MSMVECLVELFLFILLLDIEISFFKDIGA